MLPGGATIRDVDGNYYIDWVAGIAVLNVGHNNPYVKQAIMEQLDHYWHWMSEIPSEARIRFLRNLQSILPGDLRGRAKVMTSVTGLMLVKPQLPLPGGSLRSPLLWHLRARITVFTREL